MSDISETYTVVIGRALAIIALNGRKDLAEAGVGERGAFLEGLGLPRGDVAKMLNTSADSLKTMVGRLKGKGAKRRVKSKKK